jgi:YggT family protein
MILFANFLIAVSKILNIVVMISIWVLIIRAVLSWVRIPSLYSVSVILYYLTEPVLGGIDISPMIVILILVFIDTFLIKSLSLYAYNLLREHTLMY